MIYLNLNFIILLLFTFILIGTEDELVDYLNRNAYHISEPSDLDPLLVEVGDVPYVLLGESSHGTSEYYSWRAEISKRLIEEKNFSFIAVEGDWSAAFEVNKYIKNLPGAANTVYDVLKNFNRWPQWMWANEETAELIEWLRAYNSNLPVDERVGFYGIDLYTMWESIELVKEFLASEFPHKKPVARELFECFQPYSDNPQQYAISAYQGMVDCREEILKLEDSIARLGEDSEFRKSIDYFNAKQNVKVIKNAEEHYRNMVYRGPASWNTRVFHFKRTVERIMDFYNSGAKGIVWAHNTHVGDARATPMTDAGMYNIGQLLRERHGRENVFIVGFGTHRGKVIAGREWGGRMEIMDLPRAINGSFEDLLYRLGYESVMIIFDDDMMPGELLEHWNHRAKGVVYHPENEAGNYVPTVLPQRYNAFVFIDETNPLKPVE